jgi:hypothetical protein
MIFSAKTVYTLERLARFSSFTSLKKKWVWIFIGICTAIVGLTFALQFLLIGFDKTITYAFVGVILIDALYFFLCFVFPKIALKKSPALNAEISYEFTADGYRIEAVLKNGKETSELNYDAIKKVLHSKDDIYLYIASNQAYIIDRGGFTVGSDSEFINFIETKIEAKEFLKKRV